jgi:RNA-directed DNA polymerase
LTLTVERWLKAPIQQEDGLLLNRDRGTPQGSVISPLLANIFLHHAFARWMQETFPQIPFEYYADDVVVHCKTFEEAEHIRAAIAARLALCRLELHPDKTRTVYCKDANRSGSHEFERFDFLGFTFRPRSAGNQRTGQRFVSFTPAISDKAGKAIRLTIRSWHLGRRSDKSLEDLARGINPVVRGWINYYGRFYKSAMVPTLWCLEYHLARWAMRKFKRLRGFTKARDWMATLARRDPVLFAHWNALQPGRMLGAV